MYRYHSHRSEHAYDRSSAKKHRDIRGVFPHVDTVSMSICGRPCGAVVIAAITFQESPGLHLERADQHGDGETIG